MASKRSRRWRGEEEAHQTPRCSSGWHGRAVPARPARGCLGRSSPRRTGELTRSTSTGASSASSSSVRHSSRGAQRQQISREEITPISSGRKRSANPLREAGRGRGGEHFTQGGDGGGYRSRPEWPGGGGSDPDRQRDRGEREESVGGWAGSVDRPRPEPCWLSRARAGRLGQQASWAK
jgi:hypothetical protein